eukprot:evm.model.scf_167.15 EVM.evm.TU.scf_167.15   scf_167:105824-109456(-)
MGVPFLTDIALCAVVDALLNGTLCPGWYVEDALITRLWTEYRRREQLRRNRRNVHLHSQNDCVGAAREREAYLQALKGFALHWHFTRLQLTSPPGCIARMDRLWFFGSNLVHMEASIPTLSDLTWVAFVPNLTCLSLRGCQNLLPSELVKLSHLHSLQALDMQGLSGIDQTSGRALASLAFLKSLNLGDTDADDTLVECLTYGRRLANWCAGAHGDVCSAGGDEWPPSQVSLLRLNRTRVTERCVQYLLDLETLLFLDLRGTGIVRSRLAPLERRFGLRQVQGAVLSTSSALASLYVTRQEVACVCPASRGSEDGRSSWAQNGARELLLSCVDLP